MKTIALEDYEPKSKDGIIISNPPYGERIKSVEINDLYKRIGDNLKQKFNGFDAWFISSNAEAFKNFGLKTSRKVKLYNGPLECRFNKYSLYDGSKKQKYNKED